MPKTFFVTCVLHGMLVFDADTERKEFFDAMVKHNGGIDRLIPAHKDVLKKLFEGRIDEIFVGTGLRNRIIGSLTVYLAHGFDNLK